MQNDRAKLDQKILELVREAVNYDNELRQKYNVADKFRFIRDRLYTLLKDLEDIEKQNVVIEKDNKRNIGPDKKVVYVHLYNVNGMKLASWQNMCTPKVFYEYSVNRPIYDTEQHIQSFIKSKSNKMQHAYLTFAIDQSDLISSTQSKDPIGNDLIRIKEGSLHLENFICFTHNDHSYVINAAGELTKAP